MTGSIDVSEIIRWAFAAVTALLAWLYKGHESRISSLEVTRVMKADADEQRQRLRDEVKEFRGETTVRLEFLRQEIANKRADGQQQWETLRVETNSRLEKLSDQIGEISREVAHR